MVSTNHESGGVVDAVRRHLPAVAFGVGLCCLLAMVPVTLGALAGALTLGSAVPVLGVAMAVAFASLVLANH